MLSGIVVVNLGMLSVLFSLSLLTTSARAVCCDATGSSISCDSVNMMLLEK